MKKLLLLLLCVPLLTLAQQTYVPDDNFENYLEQNGMGNGIPNDDYVTTANINTATYLDVFGQNISDLTGIEDFNDLTHLDVSNNNLTALDITQNASLNDLFCYNNMITYIDLSGQTSFINLWLFSNLLGSLDLSHFACGSIGEPWIANAPTWGGGSGANPNLQCIQVDDVNCWNYYSWGIDTNVQYFSINCNGTTDIQEHTTNKQLLKITDILGREVNEKRNTPLFYIYNDGTVEKKMIIE